MAKDSAKGLLSEMAGDKPGRSKGPKTKPEGTTMGSIIVRMPVNQKEALRKHLWEVGGEKLSSGIRRILNEFMEREGI